MTEHWQRSRVTGGGITEVVLHKRGQDPMVMACRRNHKLAGSSTFEIRTEEAFSQVREGDDGYKKRGEIPRDKRNAEEWDW